MKTRCSSDETIRDPAVQYYFQRFGFCDQQIQAPPPSDLRLVVVIPCFNEPELAVSLESLWNCDRTNDSVEVIVVTNSACDSPKEIRVQNQETLREAASWIEAHRDARMIFHLLHFPDLPAKHAGVGLARKIGMDEALRRFALVNQPDGLLVSFDADCRCAQNYLTAIDGHFRHHRRSPGCSIYFEHPLAGPLEPQVYEAVTRYELHLRYFVRALCFAGFPFAHHTIGSCMVVRSDVYRKQGGMNKRQAGEDFYFLNKVIPLGGFTDLTATTVYPSPRISNRVPFGTGKAIRDYLATGQMKTYALQSFADLKILFDQIPTLFSSPEIGPLCSAGRFPESLTGFLKDQDFVTVARELRANTATVPAFRKRFFRWFDAFRVVKFLHYARDRHYGPGEVGFEARMLLNRFGAAGSIDVPAGDHGLLELYRRCEKARSGLLPGR